MSRLLARALATAVVAAAALNAHAQMVSEAAVKAAFLHKFLGFIEWHPKAFASSEAPIVVGTAGSDEVAAELERLAAGRAVLGRPVLVRKLGEADNLTGLHVLFVGRGEPATRAMVRRAREQGVLAVTEAEGGLEQGAAINFLALEDRIGFEVSLEAAEHSGHRISSRMLAVARRVVPRT